MTIDKKLRTQIIGAAGELLVQYQLLKHEIDSARLTTDSGIDLVMYVPGTTEAATVQVKAMQKPYTDPRARLEWGYPLKCKADWLAVVDVSRDLVWLFPVEEAIGYSGGTAEGLTYLSWYVGDKGGTKYGIESDFERYRLDNVIGKIIAEAESADAESNS
jgi:hypothetical protein